MKFQISAFLLLLAVSTNALMTPTRQSIPSSSLVSSSKTPASTTRLGNDAASDAVELPRGGGGKAQQGGGTATIPNEVFNLIKSIVGAGVLSLPAGK